PENMLSFVALKEKFLSECLGGKCEAPRKKDFKDLNIEVKF
ncbi:14407_t:CDS:1, partial [Dentiscutata heterogama]